MIESGIKHLSIYLNTSVADLSSRTSFFKKMDDNRCRWQGHVINRISLDIYFRLSNYHILCFKWRRKLHEGLTNDCISPLAFFPSQISISLIYANRWHWWLCNQSEALFGAVENENSHHFSKHIFPGSIKSTILMILFISCLHFQFSHLG